MRVIVCYDKDGLPFAVADSITEIAQKTGAKPESIYSAISHGNRKYVWVEIGDVPDESARCV